MEAVRGWVWIFSEIAQFIISGFPGLMGAFNISLEVLLIPGAYHADTHYFFINASVNSKCVYINGIHTNRHFTF